jgi:ribosomal protein S6--L-glutamate ligase
MSKSIIGSEEWLALEHLNIPAIKSRVDSGAKTSSIQAKNIKRIMRKGKESYLQRQTKLQRV